jgi:rhodanese-related sulfurtransferase
MAEMVWACKPFQDTIFPVGSFNVLNKDSHMQAQLQHYMDKLTYEIDAWDLSEALKANEKVIVVDARSAEVYGIEHIPGAVNIPHRTMSEESIAHLDRTALVVTYCDGIGCNASTKGALNMTRLGFRVKELMGGLDWWKRDGYATSGVKGTQGDSEILCGC